MPQGSRRRTATYGRAPDRAKAADSRPGPAEAVHLLRCFKGQLP